MEARGGEQELGGPGAREREVSQGNPGEGSGSVEVEKGLRAGLKESTFAQWEDKAGVL